MKYNKKMPIGNYIKQIREAQGGKGYWSIRSIAKRAMLSNSYLSQLEQGKSSNPSPQVLKRLAKALRCPYEDLLQATGYLPPEREMPKTIEIPIRGEVPADKFNFAFEEILDSVIVNYDFVKNKNCFALKVRGDCLKDIGIFDKDIVIVAPNVDIHNGDIVVARIGEECTMKKFYKTKTSDNKNPRIILHPCNHDYEPIILDPKDTEIEIIGKVIRALKIF